MSPEHRCGLKRWNHSYITFQYSYIHEDQPNTHERLAQLRTVMNPAAHRGSQWEMPGIRTRVLINYGGEHALFRCPLNGVALFRFST